MTRFYPSLLALSSLTHVSSIQDYSAFTVSSVGTQQTKNTLSNFSKVGTVPSVRPFMKLFSLDPSRLSMDELRAIAEESGYDTNGMERDALEMIVSGFTRPRRKPYSDSSEMYRASSLSSSNNRDSYGQSYADTSRSPSGYSDQYYGSNVNTNQYGREAYDQSYTSNARSATGNLDQYADRSAQGYNTYGQPYTGNTRPQDNYTSARNNIREQSYTSDVTAPSISNQRLSSAGSNTYQDVNNNLNYNGSTTTSKSPDNPVINNAQRVNAPIAIPPPSTQGGNTDPFGRLPVGSSSLSSTASTPKPAAPAGGNTNPMGWSPGGASSSSSTASAPKPAAPAGGNTNPMGWSPVGPSGASKPITSDSDREAKAKADFLSKATEAANLKTKQDFEANREAERKAKIESEAKAKADADAKKAQDAVIARAKADAEKQAKADAEERVRAAFRADAEAKAKRESERKATILAAQSKTPAVVAPPPPPIMSSVPSSNPTMMTSSSSKATNVASSLFSTDKTGSKDSERNISSLSSIFSTNNDSQREGLSAFNFGSFFSIFGKSETKETDAGNKVPQFDPKSLFSNENVDSKLSIRTRPSSALDNNPFAKKDSMSYSSSGKLSSSFWFNDDSKKAALVGILSGPVAVSPFAYIHDLMYPGDFVLNAISQFEFDCLAGGVAGAAFNVLYRCFVKEEKDDALTNGVIVASALARSMSKVQVTYYCDNLICGDPLTVLDWSMLQQFALGLTESVALFGAAGLALEFCCDRGLISRANIFKN